MLDFIRRRATGWLAWGIVILISIPFALWGIQQYLSPVSSLSVAEVNGTEIQLREFQQAVQEQRARLRQMLGPQMAASIDDARIREQTLERMINDQLMLEAAADAGLRIGDAQLAAVIQSQEVFRTNGSFSQERYQSWLNQQGYSPSGFEQVMRQNLMTNQIANGLARSAFVTGDELARVRGLEGQQRRFRSLVLPASRYEDVEITEEAVTARYEDDKSRYARPEQVTVEYIRLSRAEIASQIPVDEAELRSLYESRKANFVTPEQRKVSHILLSVPEDAGQDTVAAAQEKLAGIRQKIESGASFDEMAKEHSEDPGTAQNGGDLGFIGKGVMDPAFESAAYALEEGGLSEPVRTQFGLHLIKVDEIRPARTRSFEEVRDQLESDYQNEQADLLFSEQAERLANLTFEHPETLEVAADTLDVKVGTSDPFSRDGAASGIASHREVVQAAFSEDVLERENNSELLELDDGAVAVIRVKHHEPASIRPLDEVRERIVKELKQRAAREQAAGTGRALLDRLTAGESPEEVAGSADVEWSEPKTIGRQSGEVEPWLRNMVFTMQKPGDRPRTYDGRSRPDGGFQIVALESVVTGSASEESASAELRETLENAYGSAALDEFTRALRQTAEVVINREQLQDGL